MSRSASFFVTVLLVCGLIPPAARQLEQADAAPRKEIKVNRQVSGGRPEHAFRGEVERSGEIRSMRTRTSRTFQNDYGAFETEIFTSSIHYLQDGEWTPIDNRFENAADGYQNRANQYAARLPRVLGAAPVRFGVGTEFVSLDLADAAPVRGHASANRVEYADALPGVDVIYEAFADQLKDSMMLEDAAARSDFSWRLQHSPALTPAATPDGGIDFTNAAGELVTSIVPPLIHDARGPSEGAAPPHAFSLEPGEGFDTLRLTVDEQWLSAPERQFPVTVDPTWVINAQKDCYIADGTLSNNSFCGTARLQVGRSSDGFRNRSLLRFDMGQFPNNAEVLNASLGLYLNSATTANTPAIEVRRLTKNFVDGWATWQSSGAGAWTTPGGDFSADGYVKKDLNLTVGWKRFYITRLAKDWIAKGVNDNHGVIVKLVDESVTQLLDFSSMESSTSSKDTRPVLSVTWDHGGMGDLRTYKVEQEQLTERRERRVNVAGGNLLIHETDFKIKGTGLDLVFERYYNSLVQADHIPTQTPLGTGWSLSEGGDVGLKLFDDGETVTAWERAAGTAVRGAAFFGPSGYRLPFVKEASDGSFQRPPGLNANLRRDDSTGNYVLTFRDTEERYVFSSAGTLLEHKDKNDNKISFFYNASNKVSSIKDTQGRTTTFIYNASGMLGAVEDPAYRRHQYGYDPQDPTLLRTYTDPSGAVTSYDYDQFRRIKSITDAEGHQTLYEYNDKNYVTRITEVTNKTAIPPTGDVTELAYVQADSTRCPSHTASPTADRSIGGAEMPLATTVKNARGHVTTYCYNELSRVRLVKDADNNKTYLSYNSDANVTSYIDAHDREVGFSYDQTGGSTSGNLIGTLGFSAGTGGPTRSATNVEYDIDSDAATVDHPGFPGVVTDTQGNKTRYEYDDAGNLTKVVTGVGSQEQATFVYHYGPKGTLTRVARPPEPDRADNNGAETQGNDIILGYDTAGNLTGIDHPEITSEYNYRPPGYGDEGIGYDNLSRVTSIKLGNDIVMMFRYDDLDRLKRIDYERNGLFYGGIGVITYSYDKVGNLVRRDDWRGETGSTSTSTYTYDVKNQPDTESHGGAVTSYDFDPVGNLASATRSGETTRYVYDNVNVLKEIVEPSGAKTTFQHDATYKFTYIAYPNFTNVEKTYDHAGNVRTITARKNGIVDPFVDLRYDYTHAASNKDHALLQKVVDRRFATPRETTYAYDALNRLKEAKTTQGTTTTALYTYAYDANGNITRAESDDSLGKRKSLFSYGTSEELWCAKTTETGCEYWTQNGDVNYTYDANGNMVKNDQGLYVTYDPRDHTRKVQKPGSSAVSFEYLDATQDERISKTSGYGYPPMSTYSMYDMLGMHGEFVGNDSVSYVRDNEGTPLGQNVVSSTGTRRHFYVTDHLGSVVALTDASGDLTRRYTYDPYGNSPQEQADGLHDPWRFAGTYYDEETGWYKMGARYYDPGLYRFTQKDPMMGKIQDPVTLNPYIYAAGDPINHVDPTGRSHQDYGQAFQAIFEFFDGCIDGAVIGGLLGAATPIPVVDEALGAAIGCAGVGYASMWGMDSAAISIP